MIENPMQFQLLPSLSETEYEALKADIAARGVMVPIEKDEAGNILDGFHRSQICAQLGITDFPVTIRVGMSDDEKIHHALALNLDRRHLEAEQRRELVARLKVSHGWSNRMIADAVGVDERTVRRDLGEGAAIAAPDSVTCEYCNFISGDDGECKNEFCNGGDRRVTGKDGKSYPARMPRTITTRNEKEALRATDALSLIGWEGERGDIKTAGEVIDEAKRTVREQNRAQVESVMLPPLPESMMREVQAGEWYQLGNHTLYCGDSSSAEFRAGLPQVCPFAFADPPYNVEKADWDKGFLWQHDWLSEYSGAVAVTPGVGKLQDFFSVSSMPYKWTFSAWIDNGMTRGAMGFGNTLLALLFSTGSIHHNVQDFMKLSIETSTTDQTKHPSRKPAAFVARLIQIFTREGEYVLDPFLGSGTTLFAAEELGRKCIGAEISAEYCAEIIARWENKTGEQAEQV